MPKTRSEVSGQKHIARQGATSGGNDNHPGRHDARSLLSQAAQIELLLGCKRRGESTGQPLRAKEGQQPLAIVIAFQPTWRACRETLIASQKGRAPSQGSLFRRCQKAWPNAEARTPAKPPRGRLAVLTLRCVPRLAHTVASCVSLSPHLTRSCPRASTPRRSRA